MTDSVPHISGYTGAARGSIDTAVFLQTPLDPSGLAAARPRPQDCT